MVNRLLSQVGRHKWVVVAFICVCVVVLGFGIYFAVSTWTGNPDTDGNEDSIQLDGETQPGGLQEKPKPGVILEATQITIPEPGGAPGWSFGAERIEYDLDGNHARLVEVDGIRFIRGMPEVEIHAGVVNLEFESGKVDFDNYVTVKSKQGPGFSAGGVTWDPDTMKFRAHGNVRYENGSSKISGDELEIDVKLEVAQITGNVRFRSQVIHGPQGGFAR